jgi:hypothetical protein
MSKKFAFSVGQKLPEKMDIAKVFSGINVMFAVVSFWTPNALMPS